MSDKPVSTNAFALGKSYLPVLSKLTQTILRLRVVAPHSEGNQVLREVAPNEFGSTSDSDSHFFVRFLSRNSVGQTALRKPFKAWPSFQDQPCR